MILYDDEHRTIAAGRPLLQSVNIKTGKNAKPFFANRFSPGGADGSVFKLLDLGFKLVPAGVQCIQRLLRFLKIGETLLELIGV